MFDRWFSALGVRHKILAVVIVTLLLTVSLSGLIFIAYDLQQQKSELLDNITAVGQVTAQRSAAAVAFVDKKSAQQNLLSFALLDGVQAACLYMERTDKVLAQWSHTGHADQYPCLKHSVIPPSQQDRTFVLALPVVSNNTGIGVLTLYGDFSNLYHRAQRLALSLLIISGLTSVAAVIATKPLQQRIYQPIVNLGEVARRVGKHSDYTIRATKSAPDELGDTVEAFNAMLQHLEDDKLALEKLAYYDTLTGLPNRRLFMEKLAHAIAHTRLTKLQFGLIFIDMDNFKWVNDNLGHDRGDWLLKIFADRTHNAVRDIDTVCRLGGDEFTVILLDLTDQAQAEAACEAILKALEPAFQLGNYSHTAGASLGLAISDGYHITLDSIIKQADLAVYEAKKAGKNTYRVFKESIP